MATNKRRTLALYLCSVLLPLLSMAQPSHRAPVAAVSQTGHYRIALPPGVVGLAAHNDLRDLRLRSDSVEVPYAIERSQASSPSAVWHPYNYQMSYEGKSTRLIIDRGNLRDAPVVVRMTNASVVKSYSIEGGNNGSQWFALASNSRLAPGELPGDTLRYLQLPLLQTPYRYLRMVISDSTTAPLDIRAAGYWESFPAGVAGYDTLPPLLVGQPARRARRSMFRLSYGSVQRPQSVALWLTGQPTFYRQCSWRVWCHHGARVPGQTRWCWPAR